MHKIIHSIHEVTAVVCRLPSSSRSTPVNQQSPEMFISSQELTSTIPHPRKDPTDNQPVNIVFGNIEAIVNQALNISDQKEREATHSSVTLEPPPSRDELLVIGQAIPPETDSRLEVLISPPPYPPRIIQGPPSISGAPPSYSAVMRLGSEPIWGRAIAIRPSPPFIAPPPPPAYTQAVGYAPPDRSYASSGLEDAESYSDWIRYTLDQMVWGSDPITMICPRCANVIMTSTYARRSGLSHLSAVAMFFCGCWPCCLLPYCMDSCKNTYHYCPRCQAFLGVYRPWRQTETMLLH
ncbi:lipopolysaccharide-induced tumor necrosis factor-alpha factor homolog isoform X2 [Agrilus planipennis]|uniref:Lipopolysaccharide-induced tumor necrosis factor-alpha factor homolog isoform X2 n=1 Tax=Agrilus planipennis TaxID=224129 RepID=A0A1W4W507_AGRPL|nr:lipopolysaccharide-induced tumor necrosis factor-alpha factor homolog isoform X2 [Agrilus planipennis]